LAGADPPLPALAAAASASFYFSKLTMIISIIS